MKTVRPALGLALCATLASSSPAQERNDASGPILYANLGCETCHGSEGVGTAAGPRLATDELSVRDFIGYVRRPTGSMEAYAEEDVSDGGLSDVYAYLEAQPREERLVGRAAVGATLYRQTGCYSCHSNEAQGGAQGPRLGPDPATFAMFSWYTRNPSGSMPPYTTSVLSERDLADIYAFVEARPEPPPVGSLPLLDPKK